jgi:hypothetical protein
MDNNEEQMTPEILKGMDEMTNIQNVVKTINYDMINATKVCLDASKQLLDGRICHPVSLDKIEPHLGDQVMGELGGEKLVLKEDGSLTTVPNFAHTEFIQEMKPVLENDGTVSIVPKKVADQFYTNQPSPESKTAPLVVNLFAGPGAGKSTGAAFLFAFLKLFKVNVELVTEFAKELAWEGDKEFMARNQMYITGQQVRRMNRLVGKVDVIITDSPIEMAAFYTEEPTLKQLCKEEGAKFSNRMDFFIERTKEYNPSGRNQTFEEAMEIDRRIRELNPNMQSITGDVDGYTVALNKILDTVRPNVASPSMGVANPWGIKIQIIHNK